MQGHVGRQQGGSGSRRTGGSRGQSVCWDFPSKLSKFGMLWAMGLSPGAQCQPGADRLQKEWLGDGLRVGGFACQRCALRQVVD